LTTLVNLIAQVGKFIDCTIEIDGDEDVILEEDDEEDESYLFAGLGIGKT
jgi:hypothetical protein